MRILLDARVLGKGGTTGISGYARDLFSAIFKAGPENQYELFYTGLRKNPLPAGWLTQKNISLFDRRIPNKLIDAWSRIPGTPLLDKFISAEVIFSPHFNSLPRAKTPRVITFHDLSFLRFPGFFSGRQRFWHWLQDYKNQAHGAQHIIAVSEFTKADIVEFLGIPPEKVSVIYSGVGEEFRVLPHNHQDFKKIQDKYDLHSPFILSLGTLEPRKNIPALIEAFNLLKGDIRFKDYNLVLAGRPGYRYQEATKAAMRSKFGDKIIFVGNLPDAERVLLYNLARVFVYPSFFEGFGFPPLEAQACGVPVVAANRTSMPEILGDSAIFINPWKASEIAEAIIAANEDSGLRNRIIASGLTNKNRFGWSDCAKKTLSVITMNAKG